MDVLDTVALRINLPEHGLRVGDVGAAVEQYARDRFEVEFVKPNGRTRALLTLDSHAIRRVRPEDVLAVRKSA